MLEIGTKAPAFELPDQNGKMHTLEEYRGKRLSCISNPDNTPGCTKRHAVRRAVSAVYGEGGCRAGSEQRQRGVS